jgi:hypothetical protein
MSALHFYPSVAEAAAPPRGSRWAAAGFLALWRSATALRRQASRPRVDATAEANRVRAIAMDIRHSDPRFAEDLFAAADRHEQLHG